MYKRQTLDSAILDGTDLSNTNLEDSFAYSTQFENVKIQGADFTNVFLPKDIIRRFCESASVLIQSQIEIPEKL